MPPARAQHVVLRPFPSASWLVVAGQGLLAAGLAVAVWVFLQLAPAQPAGAVLWWPVVAVLTLFLYRAWQGRRPRGWTGGVSTLVGDGAAAGLGFAAASMLWLVPLTFGLGLAEITVRLVIGEVNQRALEFSLEAPPLGGRQDRPAWLSGCRLALPGHAGRGQAGGHSDSPAWARCS